MVQRPTTWHAMSRTSSYSLSHLAEAACLSMTCMPMIHAGSSTTLCIMDDADSAPYRASQSIQQHGLWIGLMHCPYVQGHACLMHESVAHFILIVPHIQCCFDRQKMLRPTSAFVTTFVAHIDPNVPPSLFLSLLKQCIRNCPYPAIPAVQELPRW